MYIPSHFLIEDVEIIYNMIQENSFATLFSQHDGLPYATHLPLILDDERNYLYGHFARPNLQWRDLNNQTVLAVFQGPHCYISPSWFETDKAVPTWNYVTVHVYGEIELIDDQRVLMDSLKKMVSTFEETDSSYKLDQIDAKYISGMSKGIQGFKMRIDQMEGKAKLSQNHPRNRQKRIVNELEKIEHTDEQRISSLMKANIEKDK